MLKSEMTKIAKNTLVIGILLTIISFVTACSNNDYNPDDYFQSLLSGEYGHDRFWTLTTILNGDTIQTEGFVRFDSKYLKEADFRFVDVIPGESFKEFKNVELSDGDTGVKFTIDYPRKNNNIQIYGTVTLGEMTVDMTMSE